MIIVDHRDTILNDEKEQKTYLVVLVTVPPYFVGPYMTCVKGTFSVFRPPCLSVVSDVSFRYSVTSTTE